MRNHLLAVIIFTILIICLNLKESSGSTITYGTYGKLFTKIPTVCTVEPEDSMISETKAEDMMRGTKEGVLEWKYMLQAQAEKPLRWDINYVEITKENRNTYDYSSCDLVIYFQRQMSGETPQGYSHILGHYFFVPAHILIYYQQFGTCQSSNNNYVYGCYKDDVITTPALALTVRHEFGHALGLNHYVSDNQNDNLRWGSIITEAPSIMVIYDSQVKDFKKIQQVDIDKVREIYGKAGFGEPLVEKSVIQGPQISPDEFPIKEVVITRAQYTVEHLSGTVFSEMTKGEDVKVTIVKPDGTIDSGKVTIRNYYYDYPIVFDYKSLRGTYYVTVNYDGHEIYKQAYLVADTPTVQTPQSQPEQNPQSQPEQNDILPASKKLVKVVNTDYSLMPVIEGGKVLGITADHDAKSLLVSIETSSNGTLTITLPRDLIDSKTEDEDYKFFVLTDGEERNDVIEKHDEIVRTLTIPFEDGSEEIEIIGTVVVPEFGFAAVFILSLLISSVILFIRFRESFHLYRS